MTVALALAILVVGLAMLGLAVGFGGGAVRRTKAREQASESYAGGETATAPLPYGPPPADPYGTPSPAQLPAPRDMWIGAGVSATLGMGALVGAAIVLVSLMAAPTRVLHAPVSAGGLQRDDSPTTQQVTSRQRERLRAAGMPNPLTAVYHRPDVQDSTVLFIGSSGHIDAPASRLREFLSGLAASVGTTGREPTGYPAGHLKGTVLCMDQLNSGQATLATCGWADDSTLGVITTDAGDASQTATLLLSMRDDMETKA